MRNTTGREIEKQNGEATASFHWCRLSRLNSGLQIWWLSLAEPSSQSPKGLFLFAFNQSECLKSLSSLTYILSKVENTNIEHKALAKVSLKFKFHLKTDL